MMIPLLGVAALAALIFGASSASAKKREEALEDGLDGILPDGGLSTVPPAEYPSPPAEPVELVATTPEAKEHSEGAAQAAKTKDWAEAIARAISSKDEATILLVVSDLRAAGYPEAAESLENRLAELKAVVEKVNNGESVEEAAAEVVPASPPTLDRERFAFAIPPEASQELRTLLECHMQAAAPGLPYRDRIDAEVRSATSAYQRRKGLTVDGLFGPGTVRAVVSDLLALPEPSTIYDGGWWCPPPQNWPASGAAAAANQFKTQWESGVVPAFQARLRALASKGNAAQSADALYFGREWLSILTDSIGR